MFHKRHSFTLEGVLTAFAVLLAAGSGHGRPGTHGPSISTWDTRASSVVVGFRPGFLSGRHFDIFSYNANFTATSGKLSSQFGLHYLNLRPEAGVAVMHGIGATAIALFNFPAMARFDDGMPKLAVGLYIGAAPVALLNERMSDISIPFPIGVGLPWAPTKAVYISPWFEGSPGVNLDTRVRDSTLPIDPSLFTINGNTVTLTNAAVNQLLASSVDYKVTGSVGVRAGLDIGVRLGSSVDLNANGMVGSIGGAFGGTFVGWVGGGFTFRWDDVVSAVLPVDQRLLNENCADIEARYRACHSPGGPVMTPVTPGANPAIMPPVYPAPPTPAPAHPAPSPAPTLQTPSHSPPPPAPSSRSAVPNAAFPAVSAATSVPTTSFPP